MYCMYYLEEKNSIAYKNVVQELTMMFKRQFAPWRHQWRDGKAHRVDFFEGHQNLLHLSTQVDLLYRERNLFLSLGLAHIM